MKKKQKIILGFTTSLLGELEYSPMSELRDNSLEGK